MDFLDKYPDLLTVKQVAEILRLTPSTVYRLWGLVKTRVANGRGLIRYRKIDLIEYIESREEQGGNVDANQKKERHRKMGLPNLLTWREVQTIWLEHKGRSA